MVMINWWDAIMVTDKAALLCVTHTRTLQPRFHTSHTFTPLHRVLHHAHPCALALGLPPAAQALHCERDAVVAAQLGEGVGDVRPEGGEGRREGDAVHEGRARGYQRCEDVGDVPPEGRRDAWMQGSGGRRRGGTGRARGAGEGEGQEGQGKRLTFCRLLANTAKGQAGKEGAQSSLALPTIPHLMASMRCRGSCRGTKRALTLATAVRGMTEKRVGPNL